MMRLNVKQETFCRIMAEEIGDITATEAAIRAGYTNKNHKNGQPNAHVIASKLMNDARIRTRIMEIKRELAGAVGYTYDETRKIILDTLMSITLTNYTDIANLIIPRKQDAAEHDRMIAELSDECGSQVIDLDAVAIVPTEALPDRVLQSIKSFTPKYNAKGEIKEIRIDMYDKLAAIKQMSDITGLTNDDRSRYDTATDDFANDPATIEAAMKLMNNVVNTAAENNAAESAQK